MKVQIQAAQKEAEWNKANETDGSQMEHVFTPNEFIDPNSKPGHAGLESTMHLHWTVIELRIEAKEKLNRLSAPQHKKQIDH